MFVFSKDVAQVLTFKLKQVYVDNPIFRLHYRLTFCFLIVCTVLVCTRQYIGDHINCIADKGLDHVINTYCFFMTTYTVNRHHNESHVRANSVPHPGVGPHSHMGGDEGIRRHTYYQWVPFVLFGQALCFYFPHLLWKTYEKGTIKKLVEGMHSVWIVPKKDIEIKKPEIKLEAHEKRMQKLDGLRTNFSALMHFRANRNWARSLCECEVLNMVNVVLQIYVTDKFLNGQFWTLGVQWMQAEDTTPLLNRIFPKVTKCTFYKYGQSGSMQHHDALCIMALNIINEKIYCILWFWFLALAVITFVGLLWRLLTFLGHYSTRFNRFVWGQINPGPKIDVRDVATLTREFTFSDWLFFYYVAKNIDGNLFRLLMKKLAEDIESPTASTVSVLSPLLSNEGDSPQPTGRLVVTDERSTTPQLGTDRPDYSGGESNC